MIKSIRGLSFGFGLFCLCTNANAVQSFYVTLKKSDAAPANLKEQILQVGTGNCLPIEAVELGHNVLVYRSDCDDQAYFFKALGEVIKVPGVDQVIAIGFHKTD